MTVLHRSRQLLNYLGLDAHRHDDVTHNLSHRLARTLRAIGASTVIDVGAHRGDFAIALRRNGFKGSLLSFEPDDRSFPELKARSERDPLWSAFKYACGSRDGEALLHLSQNEVSTSLAPATELHVRSAPTSVQRGTQQVQVRRLDHWMAEHGLTAFESTFVKIDVQGSELAVLEGLGSTLGQLAGLQLEVSFRPLYTSGAHYLEVLSHLDRLGYVPTSVAPVFLDAASGICLQADITLIRSDLDAAQHA